MTTDTMRSLLESTDTIKDEIGLLAILLSHYANKNDSHELSFIAKHLDNISNRYL